MKLPAQRTKLLDQGFFDKMVNVFGGRSERVDPSGIGLGTISDFVERGKGLLHFSGTQYADRFDSLRPRTINSNLVKQKALVERKGALERVEARVWLTFETPSPQSVVFAFGH